MLALRKDVKHRRSDPCTEGVTASCEDQDYAVGYTLEILQTKEHLTENVIWFKFFGEVN